MAKNQTKKERNKTLKGSCLWGMLLFGVLLLIDLITKLVAEEYFTRPGAPEKIEIIPGWINLCLEHNPGIAYGIGGDAPPWLKITVIAATAVLMAAFVVLYFLLDKRRAWMRTSLVFIVAGGVGNLIDRLCYRVWNSSTAGVRDMVDLSRFGFAVCNFADFFIVAGAIMLVFAMLFFDKEALFPMGKYKEMAKELAIEHQAQETDETEENNG